MKIVNFRGDLTDKSAKKEALVASIDSLHQCRLCIILHVCLKRSASFGTTAGKGVRPAGELKGTAAIENRAQTTHPSKGAVKDGKGAPLREGRSPTRGQGPHDQPRRSHSPHRFTRHAWQQECQRAFEAGLEDPSARSDDVWRWGSGPRFRYQQPSGSSS